MVQKINRHKLFFGKIAVTVSCKNTYDLILTIHLKILVNNVIHKRINYICLPRSLYFSPLFENGAEKKT